VKSPPRLAPIFLSHARRPAARDEDGEALELLLARTCAAAREPWSDVKVTDEVFVHYLAERLPQDAEGPLEQVLDAMYLSDLYLVCACVHGEPGALAALERHHLLKIAGFLRSPRRSPQLIEDVCQGLREKLLVQSGQPPHLLTYKGEGSLRKWLEVIAFRFANATSRTRAGKPSGLEEITEQLPAPGDVEGDSIRAGVQAAFQAALREAVENLEEDEREMLRYRFGRQLPEAKIAILFQKSQPTISRWLRAVLDRVLQGTRNLLRERLHLSESELDSFIDDARSRLEFSLSQFLGTTPSPPTD
jgi:RNA polymerase sigma-70 factor (ECF subfamily)